ncbi:MAG: heavy metal translocating P-type ATPase metal-binding domain-containing protein [Bacteroidota bacterium]
MKNIQSFPAEGAAFCYHCGDHLPKRIVCFDQKSFCCNGCKTVYELLKENEMCNYYDFSATPGITPRENSSPAYGYLDNETITSQLIRFREGDQAHVIFYIPKIHCSSCIWLLENLHRLDKNITGSTVNFPRKEVTIVFNPQHIQLSQLAALLARTGYEPSIHLKDLDTPVPKKKTYSAALKIGIAGFGFGNSMMLSFPEYFSLGNFQDQEQLGVFFGYLNLLLALPVFFYSASGFFTSAWKSIRHRYLNIDAPIALAVLVTFTRSVYEITSQSGTGYFDSMTGIVFFMLIGRYFQNKTYDTLSFDRDYKSYFPVAVMQKQTDGTETPKPVSELKAGDQIILRNSEIIPADAILKSSRTHVDYSFITGESSPVAKVCGDLIYAGGKQLDGAIELEVVRPVSQSYLTRLWNDDKKAPAPKTNFVDTINRWFTISVLLIAFASAGYWFFTDSSKALNAFTAVLIVACPCGLLLTTSFAYGNLLRIFGRNKFYLKNASVINELSKADTIIFDKTGTITKGSEVVFKGGRLSEHEVQLAVSLAAQSSHPLSRGIVEQYRDSEKLPVTGFEEIPGKGIKGSVGEHYVILGSEFFLTGGTLKVSDSSATRVFLMIDGGLKGYFRFSNVWRKGLEEVVRKLADGYRMEVLSGDNDGEHQTLANIFGPKTKLFFNKKPDEKKQHIRYLVDRGQNVIMLGDGLNDAGALSSGNVGIAVSDDTNTFSPACDAILDGSAFERLPVFIRLAKIGKRVIIATFAFSLLYNIIGLLFAIQGILSPVIAAILMPASTISIVLLTTISTGISARLKGL